MRLFTLQPKTWLSKLIRRGAGIALLLCLFTSCFPNSQKPVVIWTNQQEFASYVELFNASQDAVKVVVVYKEEPVESLPPAKDQVPPDIVVGSWLKNSTTPEQFRPIDYLFSRKKINREIFYPQLLHYGNIENRQYLLPVSFNLPAIIFANKNNYLVTENHLLTPDQIRDIAKNFNKKNESNIHTTMGFAPSWSPNFLYLVAQLRGVNFRGNKNTLVWSQEQLELTMDYFHHWTSTVNDSIQEEQDFAFKYLYTPESRQVLSGACLFAHTFSDELFSVPKDVLQEIGFRWLHENNKIPVEDDMVFMGIHKDASNIAGAEIFVTWFMQEATQHHLLERTTIMDLNITTFGIAGGFSSIQNVTERVFPIYYKTLLDNLPAAQYITPPTNLLPRWESLKERVIIPWLSDAVATTDITRVIPLEQRMSDWAKRYH